MPSDLLFFMEVAVSIHSLNDTMITIQVENYNIFSQDSYDSVIASLQLHQLTCSCGHSSCLTIHGYYERSVMAMSEKITLRIVRVKCSLCSKTHAILLSSIVPYSQVSMQDHQQIVLSAESGEPRRSLSYSIPYVGEYNIKSILKKYKYHWRERLRSESIKLEPLRTLIQKCFAFYSSQFMQIRGCFNKLFIIPT